MKLFISLIFLTLLRLVFIGQVELTPDEAYYHEWSRHLDWCYFSKGPGVAATIWLGTHLWGHGEFGVRFFSPILGLGTSLLVYWLARRIYDARVAVWSVVLLNVTLLFTAGSLLMTIDPLSIFFWTAALCTLWRALENSPSFSWWWPLSGLLIGAGFLCKWTNAFLLLSVVLLLAMTPRFRRELLRPGFWTMLAGFLPALAPVWIWEEKHEWVTLEHLWSRGGLGTPWWSFGWRDFGSFLLYHFGVYSPLIFLGMLIAIWVASKDSLGRWGRAVVKAVPALPRGLARHWGMTLVAVLLALSFFFAGNFLELPLLRTVSLVVLLIAAWIGIGSCKEPANIHWKSRFLTAFALPVILCYLWIALHHDSEVNWTAPAAVSVLILTAGHWMDRLSRRIVWAALGLAVVAAVALPIVAITGTLPDLAKLVGRKVEPSEDRTATVRGWKETGRAVDAMRSKLEKQYGAPIFLIGENYGVTAELCYYLPPRPPEVAGHPACYVPGAVVPENQFDFWGRYDEAEARPNPAAVNREDDSAEYGVYHFAGRTALYVTTRDENKPPDILMRTFEEWKKFDPDIHILEDGRAIRKIRFFICHRFKPGRVLD